MAWRYLLYDVNGDGTETLVNGELKLSDPTLTRALSTPHQITSRIAIPTPELIGEDGLPIIRRWRSAIYAESGSEKIWVGGLVADYSIDGPVMTLDVAGFTAYLADQPYESDFEFVDADPLHIIRVIWEWIQIQPGANLGLVLDGTTSPVRVGKPHRDVEFTTGEGEEVEFDAGPVMINWWTTESLGKKVDELTASTPIDYVEEHYWGDRDWPLHRLRLGYPTLGNRLNALTSPRFVLGQNVSRMPSETQSGEDVVTGVIVLGAGEGRDRIRGTAHATPTRSLRRVKTIFDKNITSTQEANRLAAERLAWYQMAGEGAGITELRIRHSDSAPFGSYDVGDEVSYSGDHEWGAVDVWVKVVKMTIRPEESDDVVVSVVRSDMIR